jgi:hypothetical protein
VDLGERELPGDEVDDGDHLGLGAVATSPAFGRLDERVLRWTPFIGEPIYVFTWYLSNLCSNVRSNKWYSGQSCEWV